MQPDITRAAMSAHERELRSRAVQLLSSCGLLHGYIVEREKSCGRKGCRCERGDRHPATYVYRRQGGRLRQLYVGKAHDANVRRWVAQDKELRALLEELWEISWQRVRGGAARRKKGTKG